MIFLVQCLDSNCFYCYNGNAGDCQFTPGIVHITDKAPLHEQKAQTSDTSTSSSVELLMVQKQYRTHISLVIIYLKQNLSLELTIYWGKMKFFNNYVMYIIYCNYTNTKNDVIGYFIIFLLLLLKYFLQMNTQTKKYQQQIFHKILKLNRSQNNYWRINYLYLMVLIIYIYNIYKVST